MKRNKENFGSGFSATPDQRYQTLGVWAETAFVPRGSTDKVVESTRRVFKGERKNAVVPTVTQQNPAPDRYQSLGEWAVNNGYLPETPTLEEIENT